MNFWGKNLLLSSLVSKYLPFRLYADEQIGSVAVKIALVIEIRVLLNLLRLLL